MAQIQLLLSPKDSPIPYGVAILVLLFSAFLCVFLVLIIKVKTRGSSRLKRLAGEPSETQVCARRDDEKVLKPVEMRGTVESEGEVER